MNNNGGFIGVVSTLLLGGASLAVAAVLPARIKKEHVVSPPRPLRLVVLEDMQQTAPSVHGAAEPVPQVEPVAAVEPAAPAPEKQSEAELVQPVTPNALREAPRVFASFDDLGDHVHLSPIESEAIAYKDEPSRAAKDDAAEVVCDVVAEVVDAVQRRGDIEDEKVAATPLDEVVSDVRQTVNRTVGSVQGRGFAPLPLVEDVVVAPPVKGAQPERKRGGLFAGLGRILNVRRAAQDETTAPAAVSEALEVDGPKVNVDVSYDVPPSLSLDANGTIVEHPGEPRPQAEQFVKSGKELAEQLEREIAQEREEAEERERRETAAREEQAAQEALAHQREIERISAETEARARGEAWVQFWSVRLDPDLDREDEKGRMKLASSLAIPASWAGKLILVALEQDPSERVRARLIGALARGGHRSDPQPFEKAVPRSKVEEIAVLEALRPFVSEARWIEALIEQSANVR